MLLLIGAILAVAVRALQSNNQNQTYDKNLLLLLSLNDTIDFEVNYGYHDTNYAYVHARIENRPYFADTLIFFHVDEGALVKWELDSWAQRKDKQFKYKLLFDE